MPFLLADRAPGPWLLRPAEPGDVAAMVPLLAESTSGVLEALFGREGIGRRLADPEAPWGLPACRVATAGETLAGLHLGYPAGSAAAAVEAALPEDARALLAPFRALAAPGTWYLASLAVAPPFRRGGLGRALLAAAAERAAGAGRERLSLHVFREREPAMRLYRSAGFEERGAAEVPEHPCLTARHLVLMVADCDAVIRSCRP